MRRTRSTANMHRSRKYRKRRNDVRWLIRPLPLPESPFLAGLIASYETEMFRMAGAFFRALAIPEMAPGPETVKP